MKLVARLTKWLTGAATPGLEGSTGSMPADPRGLDLMRERIEDELPEEEREEEPGPPAG